MDDKHKDALHSMLGLMASLNVGYVPTPEFVAEAVTPHLPAMTEAVRDAIQAIEALGRVRELIASLEAESGNASAGKFIAQELRNRIGDKP